MPKRKLSDLTETCYIVCDSNEQLRVIVGMLERDGRTFRGHIRDYECAALIIGMEFATLSKGGGQKDLPQYPASDFLPDGEEKQADSVELISVTQYTSKMNPHPDLTNITSVMAEYIRTGKSFSYDAGTGTLNLTNTDQ